MEQLKQTIDKIFNISGLDYSIEIDAEGNKFAMTIQDELVNKEMLPKLLADFELIVKTIAKRLNIEKVNVDLNNYKREREHLIAELAKAAARKALLEKKEVALPAMNSYERRLVHVALATRPDLKTESMGEGSERHIVIKPI